MTARPKIEALPAETAKSRERNVEFRRYGIWERAGVFGYKVKIGAAPFHLIINDIITIPILGQWRNMEFVMSIQERLG